MQSFGMARIRNRYRKQSLSADDKERLLLAFGSARADALRYEGSLELGDLRRGPSEQLRKAIDAIAFELTGDKQFYIDAGITISGYMKLLQAMAVRRSDHRSVVAIR